MMSDTNTLPPNTSRVPRNAMLIGGGVALAGLGLAAGLLFRSPAENSTPATAPVVAATAPAPNDGPAPDAAPAPAKEAKPAPHRATQAPARTAQGTHSAPSHELQTQPAAVCATCGVIEAVRPIEQKGQGTGIGAVGGAVVGGLLGNQMGGGKGKTAMTVLGAVGGGLAGNEVEKRARSETIYEVHVRMDDGSTRTFTQKTAPTPGTRVTVDGQTLHTVSGSSGSQPGMLRTSDQGSKT
jgi:outer membrane lipoprotein SlyB